MVKLSATLRMMYDWKRVQHVTANSIHGSSCVPAQVSRAAFYNLSAAVSCNPVPDPVQKMGNGAGVQLIVPFGCQKQRTLVGVGL